MASLTSITTSRTAGLDLGNRVVRCLLLVCLCFTLTSEGYISWLYHLMDLASSAEVDWHVLVGNYSFQALGTALACLAMRSHVQIMGPRPFVGAIVAHFVCAAAASCASTRAATLAFGYLMAIPCGLVQAYYLTSLYLSVDKRWRGTVFGTGYACSIVLSLLLSRVHAALGGTRIGGLVACAILSAASVALVLSWPASTDDNHPLVAVDVDQETTKAGRFSLSTPALACLVVFGMCLEKGLGYGFPSADIDVGVSVEFSRLFYAAGLVIAGITTDHSRLYGTVCASCALVTPFALLALAAEPIPATVLWSLDYFLFGFSSVFRVVLFLDLAERTGQTHLAPFGLLWGRLGDAAGNALCLMLGNTTSLVAFAGVTFAATIIAAIPLLQRLFTPDPVVIVKAAPPNDNDQFDSFAQHYDLSRREREVLHEVLARHTNVEAAEALFVSESTIKFHMRNLLKKTGCKRRADLRELYARETES